MDRIVSDVHTKRVQKINRKLWEELKWFHSSNSNSKYVFLFVSIYFFLFFVRRIVLFIIHTILNPQTTHNHQQFTPLSLTFPILMAHPKNSPNLFPSNRMIFHPFSPLLPHTIYFLHIQSLHHPFRVSCFVSFKKEKIRIKKYERMNFPVHGSLMFV